MLMAADQKPRKSLKSDITQHQVDMQANANVTVRISPINYF